MKQTGKQHRKTAYRVLSILLLFSMLTVSLPYRKVHAANKVLTVESAKSMALSQSDDYTKLKSRLELAKVQYTQSVKAIKLKEKNQKTFRWSPLLNFKFPEKPNLSEEFEYTYKAMELQSQISVINHSLADCIYSVYEEVALCYTKVYVLQERIAFYENRIDSYERTVEKNRALLNAGQANQADVDAMETKLETLRATLVSDMRSFEAEKEKLGLLIGIDVSTSYTFQSPFVDATLDRNIEQQLISYTLDHDDSYYQAKEASANGLLELNTNYDLMENQYGSKIRIIDTFINQAKNGEKLDSAAFKLKYNELLENVDEPWQGSYRILFIKIPKEWLKGQIDGIRYVEDEPYALYESAVAYQGLYQEEQSVKKELTASVKEYYENYVSSQNAVESLNQQITEKEKELQQAASLNIVGKMTYEEYAQVQEEYEDLQLDLLAANSSYTEIMYSFDRLTCGALSTYFRGDSIEMSAAEGGQSYVVEDEGEGVYYFLHSMVENNIFELGLSVPENFDISITDYELWIDGVQVGERTNVNQVIRHLALDTQDVERVFIRLYDGDTFIDDCDINPSVYSGKLIIRSYHVETMENNYMGTYTMTVSETTGMLELKMTLKADQTAAFYNIKSKDGVYLVSDRKIPLQDKFRYLAALESSLEELTICFYDESEALLCEARFNSMDRTIRKKEE